VLGSKKNELARKYGVLVKNLWYGNMRVYAPFNFKRALGNFNSVFNNYGQHDSQEFVSSLLDGLHEDLNRVIIKPFIPTPDNTGQNDQIESARSFSAFIARNKSIIVDTMFG